MDDRLRRMLDPRSLAVVGASANPSKRGYQILAALRESGYTGRVYPVNPRASEVLDYPVTGSIRALPADIDLAVLAVPAASVPDALADCAAVGIAGAVVLANGFAESGAAGSELANRMAQVVTETGIRVIGPNTSGMLNTATGANLVGLPDVPGGPIGVITQSGNMLLSLVQDNARLGGPGFHSYVGLGNQADVRYDECLTALAAQPETGAVAVHAEGFADGRAFLQAAAAAGKETPIVVLRGGRSEVGQRTVKSHTGSVAAPDAVSTAVLRQAGVEVVSRSDELALVAGALATTPLPPAGRGVAVLSDGGGHAALAVDAASAQGAELAELAPETISALRELLGPAAAVEGPVDVAGATDTDPAVFASAAEVLLNDPSVGLLLIIGLFGGYHLRFDPRLEEAENTTAHRLLELAEQRHIPLVVQSCYARPSGITNHDILRSAGVPVVSSIDHATRIVAALTHRRDHVHTRAQRSDLVLPPAASRLPAGVLSEPRAREFLEENGISTGLWTFAPNPNAVAKAAGEFGGSCAVRVVSAQVIHKSEVGGVRLHVTAETAAEVTQTMMSDIGRAVPDARIDGFVVTPMRSGALELLVGATNDPTFGPLLAFGAGGTLVEALDDVTFRAAPCTPTEAREMIAETRVAKLLDGYRGGPTVDREALVAFLVAVADLIAAHPEITELDLNPVFADNTGLIPADIRIIAAS